MATLLDRVIIVMRVTQHEPTGHKIRSSSSGLGIRKQPLQY